VPTSGSGGGRGKRASRFEMGPIDCDTSIEELAALVSEALGRAGIVAVLSGGGAVQIYTENAYVSSDLDFVTSVPAKRIAQALAPLGFKHDGRRSFTHPDTTYYVECPAGPLMVGDEYVHDWTQRETPQGVIQILTPTQCAMDRLAAYYHWKDPQSLDQAVMVAKAHPVDLAKIERWSAREGMQDGFRRFLEALRS
jgi:hypothetical protein